MAKIIPEVVQAKVINTKKMYFDNNLVESLLTQYAWTGCTDVTLRDQVMEHAGELIRQTIRTHRLHKIYPGNDDATFGDLFQTGWMQIERVLYKYRAIVHCADCYNPNKPKTSIVYAPQDYEYGVPSPEDIAEMNKKCSKCGKVPTRIIYRGVSKVFNMWSQIARTVILAYIKKESRDNKNANSYKTHLEHEPVEVDNGSQFCVFKRFLKEAREVCQYDSEHIEILQALENLFKTDNRPYEGLISKLTELSGKSRIQVLGFLKLLRLRSFEFTDSPINQEPKGHIQKRHDKIYEDD